MTPVQTIELREIMFNSVIDGSKVATLRLGKRDYDKGETIVVGTERNRCLLVDMLAVQYKTVGEISDEDARIEGYNSANDLIMVMHEIYGYFDDKQVVTQAWFGFIKEF